MAEFWSGLGDVEQKAGAAKATMREGAKDGLILAGLHTLGVSNTQVPHEEGDLERDGETRAAAGDELLVGIGYGIGAQARPYAVVQHEDMTLRHDPGRNAKFLENALNSERAQNLEIIRQATRRKMGTT